MFPHSTLFSRADMSAPSIHTQQLRLWPWQLSSIEQTWNLGRLRGFVLFEAESCCICCRGPCCCYGRVPLSCERVSVRHCPNPAAEVAVRKMRNRNRITPLCPRLDWPRRLNWTAQRTKMSKDRVHWWPDGIGFNSTCNSARIDQCRMI